MLSELLPLIQKGTQRQLSPGQASSPKKDLHMFEGEARELVLRVKMSSFPGSLWWCFKQRDGKNKAQVWCRKTGSSSLFYRVQRAHPHLVASGDGQTRQVVTVGLAQSPQAAADRTRPGIQGFSKDLITVNIEWDTKGKKKKFCEVTAERKWEWIGFSWCFCKFSYV